MFLFGKRALGWQLLALSGAVALSGCGGSSSSDSADSGDTSTVTGSVFAAPVNGASVAVKDTGGNTVAGPVTTGADGSYSINIPNAQLSAALTIEASGGSFTDEATGGSATAGTLTVHAAAGTLSNGSTVHATPGTTIVQQLISQHSMTQTQAETAFQTAFAYTPDSSVAPTNATNPEAGASNERLLAGLQAALFSQLAADLGLTAAQQFQLMTAIAQDLSDGTLDSVDASGTVAIGATGVNLPVDINNRYGHALVNFRAGNDNTGLTNDQLGSVPFARVALSNSYRFQYVEGMMSAREGKTQFQLQITDAATGTTPQSGLTVTLMGMMYMASMNHSTPDVDCAESATAGTYDCTIYYLMPSSMMGSSMGYWKLTAMAGGESAVFYPTVDMAMNGNGKVVLKGQSGDMIPSMMGTENRSYYFYKDSVTGSTGSHTIKLFLAAKEGMMDFPALYVGKVLNSGTANELTVSSMSVEVSTDGSTWVAADGSGNDGYWTATGVTGLTDGVEGSFSIRLTVNGEQKTTDGAAPSGSNNTAQITFTP